jgi:hypothetical protein
MRCFTHIDRRNGSSGSRPRQTRSSQRTTRHRFAIEILEGRALPSVAIPVPTDMVSTGLAGADGMAAEVQAFSFRSASSIGTDSSTRGAKPAENMLAENTQAGSWTQRSAVFAAWAGQSGRDSDGQAQQGRAAIADPHYDSSSHLARICLHNNRDSLLRVLDPESQSPRNITAAASSPPVSVAPGQAPLESVPPAGRDSAAKISASESRPLSSAFDRVTSTVRDAVLLALFGMGIVALERRRLSTDVPTLLASCPNRRLPRGGYGQRTWSSDQAGTVKWSGGR